MWRGRVVDLATKAFMSTSFPIFNLTLLPAVHSGFASTAFLEPTEGRLRGAAQRAHWKAAGFAHCLLLENVSKTNKSRTSKVERVNDNNQRAS
jgi:hypothetical protein